MDLGTVLHAPSTGGMPKLKGLQIRGEELRLGRFPDGLPHVICGKRQIAVLRQGAQHHNVEGKNIAGLTGKGAGCGS